MKKTATKFNLLMATLTVSSLWLAQEHLRLAYKHDLAVRELRGVWRQIDDGRFSRVIVKRGTERSKGGETKTPYVPPEGSVTIEPKDPTKKLEDLVRLKYDRVGVTFRPGLQLSVLPYGVVLDAKLLYAYRFGAVIGVGYWKGEYVDRLSPSLGVTYRLDRLKFVYNTELVAGVTPIPYTTGYLGLRWGF